MRVYWLDNIRYQPTGWWYLFKEIIEHLIITHGAEIRHKGNHRCEGGTYFYIEEFKYQMKDCELFIYDEEKDILKIISFSEFYTEAWKVLTERNNKNDILIVPQLYDWFNPEIETGKLRYDFSQHNFQIKSSPFYTVYAPNQINYEELYERRSQKNFNELEDKMFMLFTTQRPAPYMLSELGYLNKSLTPKSPTEYFDLMLNYKIGLAIATSAEHCYREIEYMAIGIPFIRLEHMRQLEPPLIPNYHYIAVSREKYGLPYNSHLNREGKDEYVKAYIERFLEVKEDREFLDFVAKNAREYYLNYCSPINNNRLNHMLNLLDIDPSLKLVY